MAMNLKRICVPVDFSDQTKKAVLYGGTLARQFEAELHLLHVVEDILPAVPEPGLAILPTDQILENLKKGATEALEKLEMDPAFSSLQVHKAIRLGLAYREVCKYAKEANIDLLVVATHGRSGLTRLVLGSVAERVVRLSPCPVLVVRPEEHEFID